MPASKSGTATFSSAGKVGIRWKDWKTMPTLRPRKRASASSSSLKSVAPATDTLPVSERSRPAMTISNVDLHEPDGPTSPTASPVPICRSMSLRICTRAAPCPSERLTPARAIAGVVEGSFMKPHRPQSRSYGNRAAPVQRIAAVLVTIACLFAPVLARAEGKPVKIVALGDSLTAGYGLPAADAFPTRLQAALKATGIDATVANAGVAGDTASGGLERIDWSVPDGTDAVILELGANDALRGLDPKLTEQALDKILTKLDARHIPVLLVGLL